MKNKGTWFEVDKEGLKALQKGKPKTFIVNELVQNAWDEDISSCYVVFDYDDKRQVLRLSVTDDNPEGFKDITHAYTLFADTYKRRNPEKRGRFNLGEKQVIAICDKAWVDTTKATIIFDANGRSERDPIRDVGSKITVELSATPKEVKQMIKHAENLLVPKNVSYHVNGNRIPYRKPFKSFETILDTEILKDGVMRDTARKTAVNLIENNNEQSYIYEMGIPVEQIDAPWHIDIQQKIPLAVDRETVRAYYIQDVYADVLNNTYDILTSEQSSELWVRKATRDTRVEKEAVKQVLEKRFGDKFLVGNSFDPNANDEARAQGYNVISGNQMSAEEWAKIKEFGLVQSTSDLFGSKGLAVAEEITPNKKQMIYAKFVKKVSKKFMGFEVKVRFVKCDDNARANYGNQTVTFNLNYIPESFFDGINVENIRLLVHEIAHEYGNHTEHSYHDFITTLTGKMVLEALKNPKFYEVN
jgi:hypothetical protein